MRGPKAVESPHEETEPAVVFLIFFCLHSHSLTTLLGLCTRTRLKRWWWWGRGGVGGVHTIHMYVESIHNYSSQNIPDQILLCQKFMPSSANGINQQSPKFELTHSLVSLIYLLMA